MSVKLRLKTPEPRWEKVTIDSGTFEVLVQSPTFGAKLQGLNSDTNGRAGIIEDRLRNCIADWRDLLDEAGEPIPFSWDALGALCAQSDEAFVELIRITRLASEGLNESAEKNSAKPSSEPSTDAANPTT